MSKHGWIVDFDGHGSEVRAAQEYEKGEYGWYATREAALKALLDYLNDQREGFRATVSHYSEQIRRAKRMLAREGRGNE